MPGWEGVLGQTADQAAATFAPPPFPLAPTAPSPLPLSPLPLQPPPPPPALHAPSPNTMPWSRLNGFSCTTGELHACRIWDASQQSGTRRGSLAELARGGTDESGSAQRTGREQQHDRQGNSGDFGTEEGPQVRISGGAWYCWASCWVVLECWEGGPLSRGNQAYENVFTRATGSSEKRGRMSKRKVLAHVGAVGQGEAGCGGGGLNTCPSFRTCSVAGGGEGPRADPAASPWGLWGSAQAQGCPLTLVCWVPSPGRPGTASRRLGPEWRRGHGRRP